MWKEHLRVLLQNWEDSYHWLLYHNFYLQYICQMVNFGENFFSKIADCWIMISKMWFWLGVWGYGLPSSCKPSIGASFFCCLKTINNNWYKMYLFSMLMILTIMLCYLSRSEKRAWRRLYDHCNAGAVALSG